MNGRTDLQQGSYIVTVYWNQHPSEHIAVMRMHILPDFHHFCLIPRYYTILQLFIGWEKSVAYRNWKPKIENEHFLLFIALVNQLYVCKCFFFEITYIRLLLKKKRNIMSYIYNKYTYISLTIEIHFIFF